MDITLLASAKILKKPLDDLYELGKGKFKIEFDKWKFDNNVNTLYRHINNIQKVKTIWQFDKEVSLKKFYYPSKILIDGSLTTVNSLKKIPDNSNCIIQGIVGQGKSIFMRYLTIQEIKIGSTIPIFLECRKIGSNETLQHNLYKVLKAHGFKINDNLFDFLCKSGKITLLIDGFDELNPSLITNIITELEYLSTEYPTMRIIISSRPDSGIERSPLFRVYRLAQLNKDDLPKILTKLIEDKTKIKSIVTEVHKNTANISSLLTTPLMVSLLVHVYKSEQKIPEQLSEFYETLFITLLYRHDKSKPGYVRPRNSDLNERQLQKVFEALSFITSKKNTTTITENEINSYIEEAFKYTHVKSNVNAVLADIVNITNLITEEGFKYHYLHKSIQEYHAATFIKDRNDEVAKQFYTSMIHNSDSWKQQIKFLSQIDKYRYLKYLYIPSYTQIFNALGIDLKEAIPNINNDIFIDLLSETSIGVDIHDNQITAMSGGLNSFSNIYCEKNFFNIIFTSTIQMLRPNQLPKAYSNCKHKATLHKDSKSYQIKLIDFLLENNLFNDFYNIVNTYYIREINEYKEYKTYIEEENNLLNIVTI